MVRIYLFIVTVSEAPLKASLGDLGGGGSFRKLRNGVCVNTCVASEFIGARKALSTAWVGACVGLLSCMRADVASLRGSVDKGWRWVE